MRDSVSTVESLMDEHEAIRGHLRLVRESVKDLDSILDQEEKIESKSEYLVNVSLKQQALKQTIGYLEDGLRTHHIHEDTVLPPLIGDLLMKGIRIEHEDQLQQFKKINPALQDSNVQQFLDDVSSIKRTIENVCQAASLHSIREDGILHFLKGVSE